MNARILLLCLWPFAGWMVGTDLAVVLGWSLALTRLIFWAGYARAPFLRAFGFAAGFYPTLLAGGVAAVGSTAGGAGLVTTG